MASKGPATRTDGRSVPTAHGHQLLPLADVSDAPPAARCWIESARQEFRAIARLRCVARSLDALGAPTLLADRTRTAADDERHHTQICLDVAKRLGARDARLSGDVDELIGSRRLPDNLAVTARSALVDGVLSVGFAAGRLRRTAAAAARAGAVPDILVALDRLARDEQRHADLDADIVRWSLTVRPWLVDDLVITLDAVTDTVPLSAHLESVDDGQRAVNGLCTDLDARCAWSEAVDNATALVAAVSDRRARIST